MSKKIKGRWVVTVKCTVTKEVICEDCTEDEARNDPFVHAIDEYETEQSDYKVTDVEENK